MIELRQQLPGNIVKVTSTNIIYFTCVECGELTKTSHYTVISKPCKRCRLSREVTVMKNKVTYYKHSCVTCNSEYFHVSAEHTYCSKKCRELDHRSKYDDKQ